MKIGKKVLTAFQVIFILAICLIHYFTKHRMGMQRHMTYLDMKYEGFMRMALIIMALILLFLLGKLIKDRKLGRVGKKDFSILLLFFILSFLGGIFGRRAFTLDYYALVIFSFLISIFQFIKVEINKNQKFAPDL